MRDIPIDPIKFEGFDAAERVQGYANIFCLPVTIMKGGDIVAIVLYRRERRRILNPKGSSAWLTNGLLDQEAGYLRQFLVSAVLASA
jgi:hypothetical protein